MAEPRISEHIAALILHEADKREGKKLSMFRDQLKGYLRDNYGFSCPEEIIEDALGQLGKMRLAKRFDSPLTGDLVEVEKSPADYYFDPTTKVDAEDEEYDELRNKAVETWPIITTYYRGGETWVMRVADALSRYDFGSVAGSQNGPWGELPQDYLVPAADRTVTLQHNQTAEMDNASTSLIDLVSKENSIDGSDTVRAKVLGQLKAGRELLRAGVFSIYLLQQTLITTLGGLIDRYGGTAIGEAAKVLLGLLVQNLFS